MGRTAKKNPTPQVNSELQGFDIHINEFGEIISTYDIRKLNEFLDSHTDDKKFRGIEVTRRAPSDDEMGPPEQIWG